MKRRSPFGKRKFTTRLQLCSHLLQHTCINGGDLCCVIRDKTTFTNIHSHTFPARAALVTAFHFLQIWGSIPKRAECECCWCLPHHEGICAPAEEEADQDHCPDLQHLCLNQL